MYRALCVTSEREAGYTGVEWDARGWSVIYRYDVG